MTICALFEFASRPAPIVSLPVKVELERTQTLSSVNKTPDGGSATLVATELSVRALL